MLLLKDSAGSRGVNPGGLGVATPPDFGQGAWGGRRGWCGVVKYYYTLSSTGCTFESGDFVEKWNNLPRNSCKWAIFAWKIERNFKLPEKSNFFVKLPEKWKYFGNPIFLPRPKTPRFQTRLTPLAKSTVSVDTSLAFNRKWSEKGY